MAAWSFPGVPNKSALGDSDTRLATWFVVEDAAIDDGILHQPRSTRLLHLSLVRAEVAEPRHCVTPGDASRSRESEERGTSGPAVGGVGPKGAPQGRVAVRGRIRIDGA